ncbi:hypothetical protein OSB04_025708 [Centaurea solstitialis]|uniref:RING-type domain-containing protein n=1 Tax=Centaurea solstitialis TaxID=347529 RepID=A0AA38T1Y8_9ASTR|nr:hypothetical protein OSB04_025708 [Centaurea solstitialis]
MLTPRKKDYVYHFFGYGGVNARFYQEDACLVDLPIIRFQDLHNQGHRHVERMCFICSADYQKDDVLSQLGRCGHVYHYECVGKLLHRKQTCCPFCRSSIFSGPSPVLSSTCLDMAVLMLGSTKRMYALWIFPSFDSKIYTMRATYMTIECVLFVLLITRRMMCFHNLVGVIMSIILTMSENCFTVNRLVVRFADLRFSPI